jgi:lysophospholipase L1-like esterase
MRNTRRPLLLLALVGGLVAAACGGGSTSPSGPSAPATPTYSVTATVFYDQNANGQLDATEGVRVPGVTVAIGTGTGTSAAGTGLASVAGIAEGALTAVVRTDSLPAYFQAPTAPIPVQVPGTPEIRVPLTLPIGYNNPNLYLGLGDSITFGDGSSDGKGYGLKLQALLGAHFGRADVRLRGRQGDTSAETAEVTRRTLRDYDPAYTLILLGTNDWHDQTCQKAPSDCYTIDALRSILEDVKDWDSLPVLATIIPANPAKAPAGRNAWYDEMNARIKVLAQQQQVTLADLSADFKATGNLAALFADDVHPNDAGYQVLAQGWFKAITRARSAAASSSPRFGFHF